MSAERSQPGDFNGLPGISNTLCHSGKTNILYACLFIHVPLSLLVVIPRKVLEEQQLTSWMSVRSSPSVQGTSTCSVPSERLGITHTLISLLLSFFSYFFVLSK